MTKKDKIELLLDAGHINAVRIAEMVGTTVSYVGWVKWHRNRPLLYKRDPVKAKRAAKRVKAAA